MAYKILYIEDQDAGSIKNSLERNGLEVIVCDASSFDETYSQITSDVDAFIMDYKLNEGRGYVNAPTFAATIRSQGIKKPIMLITNEKNLKEFEGDFTNHDVFDFVKTKELFMADYPKYSKLVSSLIDAYKKIEISEFDLAKVLGNKSIDFDYRLGEKLKKYANAKDVYMFCRTIYYTIIRASGLLIGEDILAARLGVDKSSADYSKLLDYFSSCKYNGILSGSYSRWWFQDVNNKWLEISDGKSLRRMNATERVKILNKTFNLSLQVVAPINLAHSASFWTICVGTNMPLDPSEGYIVRKKDMEVWQEQEYISLYGVLENPEQNIFLSPSDREYILKFSK